MLPVKVWIREVGPRDGLQMEKKFIPTERKVSLISSLVEAGLKKIEVTSFVNPKAVAQLKDAEEVVRLLKANDQVEFSALVLNKRGMERAVASGIPEVVLVVSATETHSLRNGGRSISQVLQEMSRMARFGAKEGIRLRGAVAVAFGCPFEGEVPVAALERVVGAMSESGIRQITLADTAGLASPVQVRRVLQFFRDQYRDIAWGLHFHDTRGLALVNVYAGLEEGVTLFESSVGGLGGCPFIPNAAGNVATEDLVNMLAMLGLETGVDLEKLVKIAGELESLLGRTLPSRLLRLSEQAGCV